MRWNVLNWAKGFAFLCLFGMALSTLSTQSSVQSSGTLRGTVGLIEGNCMPSRNSEGCKPKPVEAWLFLTNPSEHFDQLKVIDSVFSNADGSFELKLKAGEYSVFTKYESEVSCERYNCSPECVCRPVVIAADSVSNINVSINKASW